jgi:hypothetical protein
LYRPHNDGTWDLGLGNYSTIGMYLAIVFSWEEESFSSYVNGIIMMMVMNELKSYQFAFALSIGTIRHSRCAALQHQTCQRCRSTCPRSGRSSDTFYQNHIRLRIAWHQIGNTRGKPSYYTKCRLKNTQKSHH